MEDLLYRARHVVRTEVDVIRNQMDRNGVEMLFGEASFIDKNKVRINRGDDNVELRSKHVLIACGTEPARPADVPFTPGKIIDSNELLQVSDRPRSMLVVG